MDDGGFIISTIGGNRVHLGSELMHLSMGELGTREGWQVHGLP